MNPLFKAAFDTACYIAAGALAAHALGIEWHRGVAAGIALSFFRLGNAKW